MNYLPKNAGPGRLIQTLFVVLLVVVLLVVAGLSLAQVGRAAPSAARTSVDGVWGLAPTSYALTGSQTLTPTVSFYTVSPAAVLTLTLSITDAKPGDVLVIGSTVTTNTIILTNNTSLAASQTITDNDLILFRVFNGQWVLENLQDNATN